MFSGRQRRTSPLPVRPAEGQMVRRRNSQLGDKVRPSAAAGSLRVRSEIPVVDKGGDGEAHRLRRRPQAEEEEEEGTEPEKAEFQDIPPAHEGGGVGIRAGL